MKKNQQKSRPQPKTKIQLKIKSKNVTNNFILTPRTASLIDQREHFHKLDKFAQEVKTQRQKKEQMTVQKNGRQSKKPEYRMVSTDHPKITTTRKRLDEDETGTHTPLLKRVSFNSDIGNKKKSTQSLINSDRIKGRKKASSKLSNSASGEINKSTLQRLIGVIIKDYKEGKLKERQLQQTLMELYDRKEKKKSVGKNKKKKELFNTFSNQFIKSSHQIRSEALVRKRKKSDEIHQSVLQGKGFVNKIIIKGITTSLFLKQDAELTNIKQNDTKTKYREPSYQINTSKSIKQIYDDMVNIKQHLFNDINDEKMDLKERMAIKIQRAWRRYRTRKILSNTFKLRNSRRDSHPFHILDEFTDEENDEPYNQSTFTRNIVRPNSFETQSKQYNDLVNLISTSLQQKMLSKQECLKKILRYLHYPQQLIEKPQKQQDDKDASKERIQDYVQDQQMNEQGKASRVIIYKEGQSLQPKTFQKPQQESQGDQSNELNSFTNKYSSKQVNNDHREYFAPQQDNTSEYGDESLTYVHSQTGTNQSFKMINIQNIEEGLKGREESLQLKKQKELEELTERLFMKKVSKQQYLNEKEKIQKWFKSRQRQLRNIKNSLLKSCLQAKNILENDSKILTSQKSKKMLKCLSDKYIKKQDWMLRQQNSKQAVVDAGQHLPCQQNEFQPHQVDSRAYDSNDDADLDENEEEMAFHKDDELQVEWQSSKGYEISPKLSRHTSLDDNQYKYQEIQRAIEQEDDIIEEGLGKIQNRQLQSDKLINTNKDNEDFISAEEISLINNYVNQTTKKFKYLCTEDKQDIFEFLFLDMVLQMFTESYTGQSKVLRAAQAYINKAKRLRKIPKGIKTNLVSCKQYLRLLNEFILKDSKNLKGLSNPMGPSASQMLRYMRDQIIEAQEDDNVSSALVLPVDIFQRFGKTKQLQLKLERYYDDQQKQAARVAFLKTALHINNKALFDSLNEMLDHERPYGVWGKPFPWKKTLSLDKKWTIAQQQKKLKISSDKTIECCSYLCGILVDKEDSLFGSHRVSQEYVMQIREDRLSKMLANDLIQNEERWIFYDDEETQILMEASAFVTKKLIKELVLELMGLRMKN